MSAENDQTAIGGARTPAPHVDRYAHFAHALPDSIAESVSRGIIRIVPVAYGALLGVVIDDVALGVTLGALLTAVLDLSMKQHSLLRLFGRRLCPGIALIAHAFAGLGERSGLRRLASLRDMRCGVGQH